MFFFFVSVYVVLFSVSYVLFIASYLLDPRGRIPKCVRLKHRSEYVLFAAFRYFLLRILRIRSSPSFSPVLPPNCSVTSQSLHNRYILWLLLMIVYTTNSYVTIQFSVHYRKNIAFHMELPQTEDGLQEGTKPLWSFLTVIKWPWRINVKKNPWRRRLNKCVKFKFK